MNIVTAAVENDPAAFKFASDAVRAWLRRCERGQSVATKPCSTVVPPGSLDGSEESENEDAKEAMRGIRS